MKPLYSSPKTEVIRLKEQPCLLVGSNGEGSLPGSMNSGGALESIPFDPFQM